MAMRKFRCADCGHTFELAYGTAMPGGSMDCPKCGGKNVHRAEEDRGYNRGGRGAGRGGAAAGRGRGGAGRGPR
jgi:putative FmdB family regulatory protein